MFIIGPCFALETFAAAHEAFNFALTENKTTLHRLVTKCQVHSCLREGGGYFHMYCTFKIFLKIKKRKKQLVCLDILKLPMRANIAVVRAAF